MRKSKFLSLLLAVAVTVTMLVAVPLTASAADSVSQSTYWALGTWSSGLEKPLADATVDNNGLILHGRTSNGSSSIDYDTTTKKAFTVNSGESPTTKEITGYVKLGGKSSFNTSNKRGVFEFTPTVDGVVDLFFVAGSAKERSVYVSQSEPTVNSDYDTAVAIDTTTTTSTDPVYKRVNGIKANKPVYIYMHRKTFSFMKLIL